ncbi:hypothetical protein [Halobaculum sp. D14]|uniref:hypothetical protein n=1 Tax=Halobaculum sp. D14 TaxID=3421642 RepID=UPI003EC0CF13
MGVTQQTLTGDEANGRERPDTLLWCEDCEDVVLRSRRYEHRHDLSDSSAVTEAQLNKLQEKVPDHAVVDTQTYQVEFHYEYVEQVTVEAPCKSDAREIAREKQSLRGEYVDTIHTDSWELDEPSQASIEYLEAFNLLPDDHDVTREDIKEVADAR